MVEMLPEERAAFHVKFWLTETEDREATIKQGSPAWQDVEMVTITMPGGRHTHNKEITDGLLHEWQYGDNMRKQPAPFAFHAYREWKAGREAPVNGTDLKNWPGVTPASLRACRAVEVLSVEDLAGANADTLQRIGLGAVALHEKAKAYLAAATDNQASEQIAAMKLQLDNMEAAIQKKDGQIAELMGRLENPPEDEPAPKRRGRPPKEEEAA